MSLTIATELETLGLSHNEAKVYIASLKAGPTTAQLLAAKSLISRPTTYLMIDGLVETGLMSSFIKGKKKYFEAATPMHLKYIVENLKRDAMAKEAAVTKIVAALQSVGPEAGLGASIRVLEGVEAANALQRDILASGATETYEVVNLDEARQWIPPVYEGDIREKLVLKCKTRTIYTYSKGKTKLDLPVGSRHEGRYLEQGKSPLHGNIVIYADCVSVTSFNAKRITVITKDAGLAQTMKTLFLSLWETAEKE
ncbi:MAG: hypothetical protein RLZZ324_508 [Candidatus Parcubacteria bacterium]